MQFQSYKDVTLIAVFLLLMVMGNGEPRSQGASQKNRPCHIEDVDNSIYLHLH